MNRWFLLCLSLTSMVSLVTCQEDFDHGNDLVHRDAEILVTQDESLPPHLKNPFYQNPFLRAALSKSSWFGPGETHVKHRDTSEIPRREIVLMLNHAGFIDHYNDQNNIF